MVVRPAAARAPLRRASPGLCEAAPAAVAAAAAMRLWPRGCSSSRRAPPVPIEYDAEKAFGSYVTHAEQSSKAADRWSAATGGAPTRAQLAGAAVAAAAAARLLVVASPAADADRFVALEGLLLHEQQASCSTSSVAAWPA